jgi:antitoxin component of MazEF toxin-antitoxin module
LTTENRPTQKKIKIKSTMNSTSATTALSDSVNVNVNDNGRIAVREAKRKRVAQMLAQPLHGDSVKFRQISRGRKIKEKK